MTIPSISPTNEHVMNTINGKEYTAPLGETRTAQYCPWLITRGNVSVSRSSVSSARLHWPYHPPMPILEHFRRHIRFGLGVNLVEGNGNAEE
jgi:hypothetical protein